MSEQEAATAVAEADGRDFVTQEDVDQASAPQTERPEWLPEKFNAPEDLAKSYQELQSKLGAKKKTSVTQSSKRFRRRRLPIVLSLLVIINCRRLSTQKRLLTMSC